jgi:hypothetical protein
MGAKLTKTEERGSFYDLKQPREYELALGNPTPGLMVTSRFPY